MKSPFIPFRFDLTGVLERARRMGRSMSGHLRDVRLNLPFISFSVSPASRERQVARELVIRLKDRRVLSASECCDDCIDKALASLQEIRSILVNKQVDLSDLQDGPLYLLIDVMALGIRQFLTYEEILERSEGALPSPRFKDSHRPPDVRQAYFNALEKLRGHLSRCLGQIAAIAGMDAPTDGLIAHYQGRWPVEAYIAPAIPDRSANL